MGTTQKPNPVERVKDGPAASPLEVLERARRLFGMRGTWMKGGYQGPSAMWDARRCLIRGIGHVDGEHADKAGQIALKAANEIRPPKGKGKTWASIPSFNDSDYTKKQDIIAVLDRAVELAKEKA